MQEKERGLPLPFTSARVAQTGWGALAIAGMPVSGIVFLILTAILSCLWSSSALLRWDEFLSLWTDRLPTLAEVVRVQRTYPISLDPLFYHVVAHAAVRVFGAIPFAMRLPSLIGFLSMQIGLFYFVRRIANEDAAVFALAFPALTSTLFFSLDGRPYGLMLGVLTLSMVSWQAATHRESKRAVWLMTLAVSIAVTVNLHYFGVLLLVPLAIAELYRSGKRRTLDIPILGAMAAGGTGILGILPFLKAGAIFRAHYCCYTLKLGDIGEAYLSMVPHFRGSRWEGLFDGFLLLAALLVLWGCVRQLRRGPMPGCEPSRELLSEPEAIFLFTLALLPFWGYVLARIARTALEPRYVIGAFPAITALLAIALGPVFRRKRVRGAALAAMFVCITLAGMRYIQMSRRMTAEGLETLKIAPEIRAALMASTTGKLYFQDAERFAFASYYEPDAGIRSRMALVYSAGQERKWKEMDTAAFNAMCMRNFTAFDIEPYESIGGRSGEFVFAVVDEPGWDWTVEAFKQAHARVRSVGSAFGVDVVAVRFVPVPQ